MSKQFQGRFAHFRPPSQHRNPGVYLRNHGSAVRLRGYRGASSMVAVVELETIGKLEGWERLGKCGRGRAGQYMASSVQPGARRRAPGQAKRRGLLRWGSTLSSCASDSANTIVQDSSESWRRPPPSPRGRRPRNGTRHSRERVAGLLSSCNAPCVKHISAVMHDVSANHLAAKARCTATEPYSPNSLWPNRIVGRGRDSQPLRTFTALLWDLKFIFTACHTRGCTFSVLAKSGSKFQLLNLMLPAWRPGVLQARGIILLLVAPKDQSNVTRDIKEH
ncbi:hypothetical protein BC830DRAFT_519225 [Chytriomyces sp. MP71]|nr:hypothetical protein BC830DRAFT_519225 [Chytriomyces sp. MP71]